MGDKLSPRLKAVPDEQELKEAIARFAGPERVPAGRPRVVADTSDFFRVDYGDVLVLGDVPYLVLNYEREGRFGLDEQPKFWVRRAVDLSDGATRIIKMVFHEHFTVKVGGLSFDCARSPRKEAAILDLVRGHPNFMQGRWVQDEAGNVVRVLDFIKGGTLADYVAGLGKGHEDYFYNHFPSVLDGYMGLVRAIKFLHDNGQKHGDIRRDHVIRETATGLSRWIDFDITYLHKESMYGYDLFGLGNVLVYLAGRGDVTVQQLRRDVPAAFGSLAADDLNIVFSNRVVNLRKVFPYVPEALNHVLMHFSQGADVFYESTDELLSDLGEAREGISR
jgi:hypothetical protein